MLSFPSIIMKRETFAVADIYPPVERQATFLQKRVRASLERPSSSSGG
jgi:hypothetical protein